MLLQLRGEAPSILPSMSSTFAAGAFRRVVTRPEVSTFSLLGMSMVRRVQRQNLSVCANSTSATVRFVQHRHRRGCVCSATGAAQLTMLRKNENISTRQVWAVRPGSDSRTVYAVLVIGILKPELAQHTETGCGTGGRGCARTCNYRWGHSKHACARSERSQYV